MTLPPANANSYGPGVAETNTTWPIRCSHSATVKQRESKALGSR